MTTAVPSAAALRDPYGRAITYLRVSVTERCNLRCFYCLPRGCDSWRCAEQLSLAETAAAIRVAVGLGIRKIRITGGEPLVRPGLVDLIRDVATVPGITDLAVSTNGTLLAAHAQALKAAGLMRVNVSLDSLRPEVFRAISGRNDLERVRAGIVAARQAGLLPVKINVVVMRGVNDEELPALIDFAAAHGAQARFIEYMPLGAGRKWDSSYVSRAEILQRIGSRLASEMPRCAAGEAAAYYPLRDGGEVGVISPVSCRFCEMCNRLRLTADGKLRPCLTSDGEVDLRAALRPQPSAEKLTEAFHAAVSGRPAHGTYASAGNAVGARAARPMSSIGG
jgi:cyclic pyranopterin phosphate synthase